MVSFFNDVNIRIFTISGANGRTETYEARVRHESYQEGVGDRRRGHRLGSNREARVRDRVQSSVPGGIAFLLPNAEPIVLRH